ncbi:MAG: DUF1566 domain-containing protein [Paludibacter sp.]|nr:DUF1566 domain-containing protein [Paludibacter sp.]
MNKIIFSTVKIFVVLSLVFTTVGCKKDEPDPNAIPDNLKIGMEFRGGIVAYIDSTRQHGLIAAPSDQSNGIEWGGYGITTNAKDSIIGVGQNNSNAIILAIGSGNYAAKLCDDLVLNDSTDWFLPSRDELNQLYVNRFEIGGFDESAFYWSSSEYTNNSAWAQNFSYSGPRYCAQKNQLYKVRAVRYF